MSLFPVISELFRAPTWGNSPLIAVCCLVCSGCATIPYHYGHAKSSKPIESSPEDVEFEYGGPHPKLDRLRRVVEFPERLFRGESKMAAHELSDEHREQLANYLSKNDLTEIHVLVNQYDPQGEWKRLKSNDRVAPGWRYTAGLFSLAGYTLLPGRVFGYQRYNPYTNTLSVNSDRISPAVHEAACAKDAYGRPLPGTYAIMTSLPGASLWKTSRAVNDVLGYARTEDDWELERETYRQYFSQVAKGIVMPAQFFVTPMVNVAVTMGGGAVGHAVGHVVEKRRLAERQAEMDEEEEADNDSSIQPAGYSKTAK